MDERAVAVAGLQLQAQGRGRGFPACAFRPEQESQLCAGFGGHLQPPQTGETGLFRPGQHGAAPAVPERLFAGPQGFPAAACVNQQ